MPCPKKVKKLAPNESEQPRKNGHPEKDGAELPCPKKVKKLEPNESEQPPKNGDPEKDEDTDQPQVEQNETKGRKRKRVRVKKLRQDVSKQLEFYFCDANLRKDRYMKELVAAGQDGCKYIHCLR